MSSAEQAQSMIEWLRRWGLRPGDVPVIADDAVFANNGSTRGSTAAEFAAAGLKLKPAEKAKTPMVVGLQLIKNRMVAANRDHGRPWLLWSPACAGLEATLPSIPRHPRDPEIHADACVDHALDAIRYAVSWYESRWPMARADGQQGRPYWPVW